jgi:FkbM family methyltransferase
MKLVYDVGMNNGDDTAYYLTKGCQVVAIEANSVLCEQATQRFKAEIADGRCTIINIGVADQIGDLEFFLNEKNPVISTFVPHYGPEFRSIPVPVTKLSTIVGEYGIPFFAKIDVEGMDFKILRDLFLAGIKPIYISAEAHRLDVFCMLVSMGYEDFQLIDQSLIPHIFAGQTVHLFNGGTTQFAFKYNSSGPFGDDLPNAWARAEDLITALVARKHTWYDIHACDLYQLRILEAASERQFVEDSYAYWRRHFDVACSPRYGIRGELGAKGAYSHYNEFGKAEGRCWP